MLKRDLSSRDASAIITCDDNWSCAGITSHESTNKHDRTSREAASNNNNPLYYRTRCMWHVCTYLWSQSDYKKSKTILNHCDEFEPSILSTTVRTKNEAFLRANRWQTCKYCVSLMIKNIKNHRWSLYGSEGSRSTLWDKRILLFHLEFLTSTIAKNLIKKVIKHHRRKYQRENSDNRRVICRELTRWPAAREGIVIAKTCFYEKCGARIWHAWKKRGTTLWMTTMGLRSGNVGREGILEARRFNDRALTHPYLTRKRCVRPNKVFRGGVKAEVGWRQKCSRARGARDAP